MLITRIQKLELVRALMMSNVNIIGAIKMRLSERLLRLNILMSLQIKKTIQSV